MKRNQPYWPSNLMKRHIRPVGLEKLAAEAPTGRPATAEEIAEAIVFLATDHVQHVSRIQ
jgi:NAD(P)-dependent dehydrogenase (short-subunit alcohol dehydrogenase family)